MKEGKQLPLVDWGMTEADCLEYCHDRGWFWNENSPDGIVELYCGLYIKEKESDR